MTRRYPDLPLIMIGHPICGLIAARYAQLHGETLSALVLSGTTAVPEDRHYQPVGLA